ncbi:MAG: hypothetical protein LLG08_06490 [Actinomycetia bacterium]|nr:hypothetical protein [Actinomycetes bacterium]
MNPRSESIDKGDGAATDRLRGWARLLLVWLVIYCVLGWRIYLPRGPGEAAPLANVLSAIILLGGVAFDRCLRAEVVASIRRLPWFAGFVFFWAMISLAAPLFGFPFRTIIGAATPLAIGLFGLAGSIVWRDDLVAPSVRFRALMIIAWVQFAVGVMQGLWDTGILRFVPFGWLNAWDAAVMNSYGVEHYAGRGFGLYLNPNPYSLLGGLLLVLALRLPLSRRERIWLAVPSAGIVFLGASRGVIVALALVALPYVIVRVRALGWRKSLVAIGAIIVGAATFHFVMSATSGELYARFIGRWMSIPALLTRGPSMDPNAIGRLDAWAQAIGYWLGHPFGTLGPPQMAVGTFMDNDAIALLVQGGIVLIVAYVGTLVDSVRKRNHSTIQTAVIPLVGMLVLAGVSQNAVAYVPSIALVWSVLGSTGALSGQDRT